MPLVVDASVGLKWVLREPDTPAALRLAGAGEKLLVPDFWLNEACNVLWLQVRRKLLTPGEAREGLTLFREVVEPTPTGHLALHDVALEIGMTISHPIYDTLYVAFALAIGAEKVVTADVPFVRAMRTHQNPAMSGMMMSLNEWDCEHTPVGVAGDSPIIPR